jgi:predicted methyltransferase
MRTPLIYLLLTAWFGSATVVSSQTDDLVINPAWRVPEVVAFIGLKPGDRVADIVSGRLTSSLSRAVGPAGTVYAIETAQVAKLHPELVVGITALAARATNIIVSTDPIAAPLPKNLDAVVIRQNYHDLYDEHMAPVDVTVFNQKVFAALKPGGIYVVLDHSAMQGSGISATDTLHRIDAVRVKLDVMEAGFTLEAESAILANPSDDHTKSVFDPSVRNHTDQFLLRFRKPL